MCHECYKMLFRRLQNTNTLIKFVDMYFQMGNISHIRNIADKVQKGIPSHSKSIFFLFQVIHF